MCRTKIAETKRSQFFLWMNKKNKPQKNVQNGAEKMFKKEIDGEIYYCLSEDEKNKLISVIERVEDLGDSKI